MILNALVDYYEALAAQGKIAKSGWSLAKVSYALELNDDGAIVRVVPLLVQTADGKKLVPRLMETPVPVKRTVGVMANFLCDNASYLLGTDDKGKPERSRQCFEAAKALHLRLLAGSEDSFAKALYRFFATWEPDEAETTESLQDSLEELRKGANLVFLYQNAFASDNQALRRLWQNAYDGEAEGVKARCLVTGEEVVPELIHPSIKGVVGAQSSGAALVSYNAPAYCSFGHEQNANAPVGKYAAFAYTSALNLLLADRNHVRRFSDTTVVFWAEHAEDACAFAFGGLLDGGDDSMTDEDVKGFMEAIVHGQNAAWNAIPVHPSNRFFILGLAPNAARLSVRFFLDSSFGDFVANIKRHYDDIHIIGDRDRATPLWALLRETANLNSRDKAPSPQMTGDTLRAILGGTCYPATLFQQTQLRIRADRQATTGRMGIVKAYLLRLPDHERYKEALQVELNENTTYQPYLLGRMFAVLETIQQAANPGVQTTIKDKYFSSACTTPAVVFPSLINLSQAHLHKLTKGQSIYYQRMLEALAGRISQTYPAHHTLYDQGVFQLGYYQHQRMFQKKTDDVKEVSDHE